MYKSERRESNPPRMGGSHVHGRYATLATKENPGSTFSQPRASVDFADRLDSAALGVGPGGSSRCFGAGCAGSRNSAGIAASNARSVFIAFGAGEC